MNCNFIILYNYNQMEHLNLNNATNTGKNA